MGSANKQATKENLIDVGVGLIRHSGYTATGINQILEAAQIPKGSFYHHFATKDEFALAVIQRYTEGENERWKRVFNDPEASPLENLRRYFKDLIATYGLKSGPITGCLLGNLSLEVAAQNPEIRAVLRQAFDGWQQAIADTLRRAIERQELSKNANPDDLAAFLVNSWEGAQVRAKSEQNNEPLTLFLEFAFNVLLKS